MDDATQGLTALLGWSTDFNGSAYNLAGSIAAALLGVALIFVVWALATKKENAKKRIILILGLAASIGLMGTGSVHAQFVVHDPGHTLLNSTEWIANVKKWVTQINEMIDAQELRLGLQKIDQLKELKSLKELADLLDDVACLSSDYSFYLNVGSNYHCLKFLNFQRVTVNLSLSTDLLFKVATVTSYFSMNSEGRMSFIEQVKESVEKAAEEMREFNESVRSTVIYKSMKGHNRKTYYQGRLAAFTRHTN
mgnify:CR=1 FL=1